MRDESPEHKRKLRSGYTTGACATATALACAELLLDGGAGQTTMITLPRGQRVEFKIERCELLGDGRAYASTIKDAGDDPDVTHGATVFTEVELSAVPGVRFHAAEGVGTVTREGLSIAVGEPAINPVPRRMIRQHLEALAQDRAFAGGFEVYVGVTDGERLAARTMNGRLGIVGGLSILGTTGIVRPFSCAAFIASIQQSIDVAHANGIDHIAASTGSTSEAWIQRHLGLPDMALVEMGDFAGAVLKHLRKVPMRRLSLCGGFGKMSKLAAGHRSLHSRDSSIDFDFLAGLAGEAGAGAELQASIRACNTSAQALRYCTSARIPLADRVSQRAREAASKGAPGSLQIDVYCIDRTGACVGSSLGSPGR